MKRTAPFIGLLVILAIISGQLMAKATWIGRVGITFFHKGYNLVKVWWQGAIAVFLVWMVLFYVHSILQQRLKPGLAKVMHVFILLLAAAGLYLTYDDFHTDITHRMLGHKFHYGFYLGWVGWMLICLFYIFSPVYTDRDRTAQGAE